MRSKPCCGNLPQAGSAPPPSSFCGGYRLRPGHRRELMPQVYEVMNLPLEPSWPDIAVHLALHVSGRLDHRLQPRRARSRRGLQDDHPCRPRSFGRHDPGRPPATDERQADRRSLQRQRSRLPRPMRREGIITSLPWRRQLLISRQLAPSVRCHYLIRCEIQAGTTAAWSCSKAPGSSGPPRWPGSWQTGRAT